MTAVNYPPYGRMILEWEKQIGEQGKGPAPADWKGSVAWADWRESISDLLSEMLWPRWTLGQGWTGVAKAWMDELTIADFELFAKLRPTLLADQVLPSGGLVSQLVLFQMEDESDAKDPVTGTVLANRSLDASLRLYLTGVLDPVSVDTLTSTYVPALLRKAGNVDLETKRDMQRPRPYQVAFLLGKDEFTHNHAKSAVTPSMISGHCVEAMMGGLAAWQRLRDAGLDAKSAKAVDALAQHMIDVGDRRVFGGVHYASDNISSWLTGLLMCQHVAPDTEGVRWLWQAITKYSRVYTALQEAAAKHPVYGLPLALLEFVGTSSRTVQEAKAFALGHQKTKIAAE